MGSLASFEMTYAPYLSFRPQGEISFSAVIRDFDIFRNLLLNTLLYVIADQLWDPAVEFHPQGTTTRSFY